MPARTVNSPVYEYLDANQIAQELGVNVKTARHWMASGQLPYIPLGLRRVVRREDLTAFLEARRVDGDH